MSTQYANPETVEKIEQKHEELDETEEETGSLPEMSASEEQESRETIASEPQPNADLPQPEVKTVDWRGTELPFDEMGDSQARIQEIEQDPDKTALDLNNYVYELLESKCHVDAANEDYWRQFDVHGSGETDGLLDLFQRLNGVDPEDMERAEQFRGN